jgi:hypothetical protein
MLLGGAILYDVVVEHECSSRRDCGKQLRRVLWSSSFESSRFQATLKRLGPYERLVVRDVLTT